MEFPCFLIALNLMSCESALRIIGGRDALRDEFPFAMRLEVKVYTHNDDYRRLCSGAAISPNWILSAAHCYLKGHQLYARYNSYFPNEMGKITPIIEGHIYPSYSVETELAINDIGLFRCESISISQYGRISTVDYTNLLGHEVDILGFGKTNASISDKPLQVLKGMINICPERDISIQNIASKTLCVVPMCRSKATACPGDSGGPVVHPSGIVGVTSRGLNCNESTTDLILVPGTSAVALGSVSYASDWISNVISNKTNE